MSFEDSSRRECPGMPRRPRPAFPLSPRKLLTSGMEPYKNNVLLILHKETTPGFYHPVPPKFRSCSLSEPPTCCETRRVCMCEPCTPGALLEAVRLEDCHRRMDLINAARKLRGLPVRDRDR